MADIEVILGADNGHSPADKLAQMYPKINRNFAELNAELAQEEADRAEADEAHAESETAHPAENITYEGEVDGADNVKAAIDTLKTVVDAAIVEGDSSPQASAASVSISGTTYPTLKGRLDAEYTEVTAQLAELAQYMADGDVALATDISALEEGKAEKTEVNALATDKADKTALDATNATVATKAPQSALDAETAARLAEVAVERGRINTLIAPPPGVDNAETADIRTAADGTAYASAGDAVRAQVNGMASQIKHNRFVIFESATNLITIDTTAKTVTNLAFSLLLSDGLSTNATAGTTSYTIDFYNVSTAKCRSIFYGFVSKTLYVANEPAAPKDILICIFSDTVVYAEDEVRAHVVFNGSVLPANVKTNDLGLLKDGITIFDAASDLFTINTTAKTITNKAFTFFDSIGNGRSIAAGSLSYTIDFYTGNRARSLFARSNSTLYIANQIESARDFYLFSFSDTVVYGQDEVKQHVVLNGANVLPTYVKTTDYNILKDGITFFDSAVDLITIDTAAKTVTNKQFTYFDSMGRGRTIFASTVSYTIGFYVGNRARSVYLTAPVSTSPTMYVASQMASPDDFFVCSFSDTTVYAQDEIARHIVLNSKPQVIPKILYRFHDAFMQWAGGAKFPIVVLGDSTVDGYRTTGYSANVIGTDHTSPYLFTQALETKLRAELGNSTLRVYNAGFSGKTAAWAVTNFEAVILSNTNYADAKICVIGMGINDGPSTVSGYAAFMSSVETLIGLCYKNGIQPVMLTTQAGMENYTRYSNRTISYADRAKFELAEKYGLEVIDMNKFTQRFNIYSALPATQICADMIHYNDAGHAYEAGVFFAHIVPRTIWVDGPDTIGFNRQGNKSSLQYSDYLADADKDVTNLTTPINGFKQHAVKRTGTSDVVMMDVWIFNNSKAPLSLVAHCESVYSQYVLVDGVSTTISSTAQTIGELDIGLHHIVVMSGTNADINWLGFKLTTA